MRNMKWQYKVVLVILFVGAVMLILLSYASLLGCNSQAERLIQILSALAVGAAVVVALSATDTKKNRISVVIDKPLIDEERSQTEKELSDDLKQYYDSFPVRSFRVHFRMTNKSGVELKTPIFTFRVPFKRQPPNVKNDDGKFSQRAFTCGPGGAQVDTGVMDVGDDRILSRRGLPYWNMDDVLDFWIRMVLNQENEPFHVVVYVNCENADGFTKKIKITPKDLLENIGASRLSKESLEQMQAETQEKTENVQQK